MTAQINYIAEAVKKLQPGKYQTKINGGTENNAPSVLASIESTSRVVIRVIP